VLLLEGRGRVGVGQPDGHGRRAEVRLCENAFWCSGLRSFCGLSQVGSTMERVNMSLYSSGVLKVEAVALGKAYFLHTC
jgi:hypothetical protein